MIDPSEYPNLNSMDEGKTFVREMSLEKVIVWDLPSGFVLDRYKKSRGATLIYRFPTLEEALKAASDLDGTAEGWDAISQFLDM